MENYQKWLKNFQKIAKNKKKIKKIFLVKENGQKWPKMAKK